MAERSLLLRLHSIPAARLDRGTMSFRKVSFIGDRRHFAQNACANEALALPSIWLLRVSFGWRAIGLLDAPGSYHEQNSVSKASDTSVACFSVA